MRKQIKKTVVLLLISIFITGCSGISNLEKGFGETKQTEYKLQDDNVFSLGEEIGLIEPTEEEPAHVTAKYIVKSVQIYTSPKEAGLSEEQLVGYVDDQRAIMKGEAATLERIISAPILIIDISITNVA